MYLHKSPCLHDEGVLEPVHDEPVDLFLGHDWSLTQILHRGHSAVHNSLLGPGGGNNLHQGDIVWGVDLKIERLESVF